MAVLLGLGWCGGLEVRIILAARSLDRAATGKRFGNLLRFAQ